MANMTSVNCTLRAYNIRASKAKIGSELVCMFGAEVKSFLEIGKMGVFEDGSLRFFDGFRVNYLISVI